MILMTMMILMIASTNFESPPPLHLSCFLYMLGQLLSVMFYFQVSMEQTFSNSLTIHQEKTKKITAVTMVWICVPNYHNILPT